jgi:acyl-CoA thioesterase FadM
LAHPRGASAGNPTPIEVSDKVTHSTPETIRPGRTPASAPFTVAITARAYETGSQGHLTSTAYLQYADHARWELLRAAGVRQTDLLANGIGPVNLETTIRFHRELLAGDEVAVTCVFRWGDGKTFRVEQQFRPQRVRRNRSARNRSARNRSVRDGPRVVRAGLRSGLRPSVR